MYIARFYLLFESIGNNFETETIRLMVLAETGCSHFVPWEKVISSPGKKLLRPLVYLGDEVVSYFVP